jgi:PKD repeat protein
MKKALLSLCLLLLVAIAAQAQTATPHIRRCWSHELDKARSAQIPGYANAVSQTFEQAKRFAEYKASHRADGETVYRVPVVVHIVWNTAAENLSDAVIQTQIDKLNEDYRRMNADTTNTRAIFQPVAADANIEFYLATEDPDGNPTNGIVRTQTDRTEFSATAGIDPFQVLADLQACGLTIDEILGIFGLGTPPSLTAAEEACVNEALASFGGGMDEMKFADTGGSPAWDTKRYCNIWVCDLNGDNPTLGLLLGFAYPPVGAPNWPAGQNGTDETDGLAIHYQAFGAGSSNTAPLAPFSDDGRTVVHEMGHYLGLRHIWGDDACGIDDGIADTPDSDAASDATGGCIWTQNNCTGDGTPDQPDMIENYMDYSSDECQNLFSRGQVDIMRAMLEGPRGGLLWQNILAAPDAAFSADITNATVNQPIQFTDLSTGSASWFWDFGDGTTSTEQNPIHTYAVPGTYTVTLTVENGFGFDYETKISYITVTTYAIGLNNATQVAFQVMPNPTKGLINVVVGDVKNATIEVLNMVGQQVAIANNVHNQTTFDLSNQAAGVYMVRVTVNGVTSTAKLSVQ